ncbi:MAG: sensor domain-containing diguanylate cyclase [Myxococcota bacterium]
MMTLKRKYGVLHIAFLAVVGLGGWIATVGLTIWPQAAFRPWHLSWEFLVTLALPIVARFLAFRVFQRVRIALDTVFYVAATFVFGVVPAAWFVLVALSCDALVRSIRGSGVAVPGLSPWRHIVAQTIHSGGLPALVLLVVGALFNVDGMAPHTDITVTWLLPLVAVTFLIVHYLLAGGSHWFTGTPPQELWREFLMRVTLAELALVPLALAMALGYNHMGISYFLLLGFTGILGNYVFRQSRISREKLHDRVMELTVLVKVGHIIAGSLERRNLLRNISTEALRLVGHSSRFLIGTLEEDRKRACYEYFEESGERYKQVTADATEGLSGWIMQNRRALRLDNVQLEYERYAKSGKYNDPEYQSWLGVPLITYDEVMGVMAVQSKQANAYTEEHLRVMTSIADQASVALENSRLYELATIDGLTNLLVRRHFDHRLSEEWRRSQRYDYPFALGIFDLDNFKELNDTYGHQAGDKVLRATAAVVRNNMRGPDLAGRYGGEEFAFLLPRTQVNEACTVAERIRAEVEALEIDASGTRLTITTSIGVAGYPESGVTGVDELVARADEALYQAKRSGKNRIAASPERSPGESCAVADGRG